MPSQRIDPVKSGAVLRSFVVAQRDAAGDIAVQPTEPVDHGV